MINRSSGRQNQVKQNLNCLSSIPLPISTRFPLKCPSNRPNSTSRLLVPQSQRPASMSSSESVSQKRPAADDVVGVTPAKLVPAPPQESALMIPEIAEHIFRFLPARQVVELRSVCGRWKKLIDGSSRLMSRVWIKFPSGDKLVQDYRLKFLPAGANSIAVGSNEIEYVDSWWPSLAQKLAHLKVDYFGGNEHHLIRMLQHSPGLKSFHLGSIRYNLKEFFIC